jgi:predicted DNA-binding transcriptional regulator YafY
VAATDPTSRILRLLGLLQRRPTWTGAELAERLGVTTRTVRRDVDRLRGLGYPVDAVAGHEGGYRLGPGGSMPPLLLEDDEATAVAIALGAASTAASGGLEEPALAALAKIDQVLPPAARARVDEVRAATVVLADGTDRVDPDVLVVAARACAGSEQLRLVYRSRTGSETERRIQPHRMVAAGRRWYLVALDVDAARAARATTDATADADADADADAGIDDGWRTFRADRIVELVPTGHRFQPRDPPDAAALVARGTTVEPYEISVRVRLDCTIDVARARVPATVAVLEPDGDRTILSTGANQLALIIGFLFQLAMPFEVLDPPEVRERFATLGDDLVRRHR